MTLKNFNRYPKGSCPTGTLIRVEDASFTHRHLYEIHVDSVDEDAVHGTVKCAWSSHGVDEAGDPKWDTLTSGGVWKQNDEIIVSHDNIEVIFEV
jgi:hypothetical protein